MYYIETDDIQIHYRKVKFGNYEVKEVKVWCEAIEDWLDVSNFSDSKLDNEIMRLVNEDQSTAEI